MNPERFEQVYELYHAALERNAAERAELLAQADPELRHEVESLLEQSGGLPDHPAWERMANLPADPPSTQLSLGTQLGPYRIEAPLGVGGMGQVYKAQDTRLGRAVAIKISLQQFNERFEREARTISALNHRHICTLYDIGANYLVMEFVEGETLAARLNKGPLPMEMVLRYGAEIADALAEAHSLGIIHRDLKPGNVMLTKAGVKVLDFGLAKFTEPDAAAAKRGEFETANHAVMGTPAYMAPERALGRELDERADLFSFGVLLYEMATGTRPFRGDTPSATVDAILHQVQAPPSQLNPSIPAGLGQIIERALEKDPDVRYQTASGIRADLKRLIRDIGSGEFVPPPRALVAPRRRGWYIVAGVITITAVSAGVIWWMTRTPISPPQPVLMRLTSDSGLTTMPVLSPDGKLVAYLSDRGGGDNLDIWIKQVDGGVPLRLTSDPANKWAPRFSPDGNQIVFRSDRDGGGIYTMPALGGDQRLVARGGFGPRFSPDGKQIAFVVHTGLGGPALFVVPSAGGRPERLVAGEIGASYLVWSPDGKFILFAAGMLRIDHWAVVSSKPSPPAAVSTVSLTAATKAGLADLIPSEWLAGNRIVFSAKLGDGSHVFEIGLSPPALTAKQWRLELPLERLTFGTAQDESPSVASVGSASGARRLAFVSLAKSENLWSLALDTNQPRAGGKLRRLTQESGFHIFPSVSTEGTKLAYISHAAYNDELWLLGVC